MGRYTGPKVRLMRREGVDLGLKTSAAKPSIARRLQVPPGMHGTKRKRKPSDYSIQMREKQKVKRMYGVLERQFRRYVGAAQKTRAATGETLLKILELRLDNVIYRLGFTPTRTMARQLVSHGHVLINNKKVDIPSYSVRIDEIITLSPKALNIPVVKKLLEEKETKLPSWLQRQAAAGKVVSVPTRNDIDSDINEQFIVEFYSR